MTGNSQRSDFERGTDEIVTLALELQALRRAGVRPKQLRDRLGVDATEYARVRRWLDGAATRIDPAAFEDALRERGAEAVTAAMRLIELNHRIGESRRQTKRQLRLTEQQLADGIDLARRFDPPVKQVQP